MVLWVLKVLTGAEPEAARGAGGGPSSAATGAWPMPARGTASAFV